MNEDQMHSLGLALVGSLVVFGAVAGSVLAARAAKPMVDRLAAVDLDEVSCGFSSFLGLLRDGAERLQGENRQN